MPFRIENPFGRYGLRIFLGKNLVLISFFPLLKLRILVVKKQKSNFFNGQKVSFSRFIPWLYLFRPLQIHLRSFIATFPKMWPK